MRRGWLLVLVCASGCTALLGLHSVPSVDRDNDGVDDAIDNCPDDYNPDQSNFDHNEAGDACDLCTNGGTADVDGDGIPDGCDGCIGINEDVDHDHIDDACDHCIGNGMDADHDGIDDACDTCLELGVDADQDGIDDGCDPCVGPTRDSDQDGIPDVCDPCPRGPQHDEDSDGVFDACDTCPALVDNGQLDGDGDLIGDACDLAPSKFGGQQVFDPFTNLDPSWYLQGTGWGLGSDLALVATPDSSYRLWPNPMSAPQIVTIASFVQPATGRLEVFFASQLTQPAPSMVECILDASTGKVQIFETLGGVVQTTKPGFETGLTITQDARVVLALDDINARATCDIPGQLINIHVEMSLTNVSSKWYPGLSATATKGSFHFFDAITP